MKDTIIKKINKFLIDQSEINKYYERAKFFCKVK